MSALLLTAFGNICACENACVEMDTNSVVDLVDLSALLRQFGSTCR